MPERLWQQFGQYRLSRFLGQGSFGEVYLGEHIYNHTLAAVKVLQVRLTAEDLKEFINEASTTLRLQHPHIVRLLDFGISPTNTPFLVMAYAANGTLRQRYPKGTRLPLERIITYVSPIASALQHAHNERLIHRDVKPENILLGPNNEVWLSDFGITSVAHSTRSLDTEKPGGTVPYMAPEQLRGKTRPASDQYALGIMVYEWLCGERPFGGMATEIAMQHLLEPPPSLREKMPTISTDVEQVVMTALAKDPAGRWASVQAFATALQTAADVQPLRDPGSTRTSNGSASGVATSLMTAPVDGASPTVQPNEQDVTVLPPKVPSVETVTSAPSPTPDFATDGRVTTQAPLSVAQKKPLPSVTITPNFLPARRRLSTRQAMVLVLLVLVVVGSGGIWATLYVTMHRPSPTPTTTTTLSPYDQFAIKNGAQFGFDAQHTRFNPYESELSPATVATLVQTWTATTGDAIGSSPTVANGVVYIGSEDGKLYAFKAGGCGKPTCSPLWTATTGYVIISSPTVANGMVYVNSDDGKLYVFKADGCGEPTCSPLWTATIGGWLDPSPAVVNGVVYIGSYEPDGKLYAFKADGCGKLTCSPLWTATTGDRISSSPAVVNGVVYIGSYDGKLYAFKADGCGEPTCSPLWTATISPPLTAITYKGIHSSPAVVNGVVYIGSEDGKLYAFKADGCDEPTCSPLWTATTGDVIISSPTVANRVVYIGSVDHKLYVFKADGCGKPTCSPLWTATTGDQIVSSPTVANGVVYVGSYDGKLHAFQR